MPTTVSVAHSSGHPVLDEAAIAAVRQWRFVAATRGGTAVPAAADVPVRFTLAE
jgi:protein TonB